MQTLNKRLAKKQIIVNMSYWIVSRKYPVITFTLFNFFHFQMFVIKKMQQQLTNQHQKLNVFYVFYGWGIFRQPFIVINLFEILEDHLHL